MDGRPRRQAGTGSPIARLAAACVLAAVAVSAGGCSQFTSPFGETTLNGETFGTGLGILGGGLFGAALGGASTGGKVAGALVGATVGGVVGNTIGRDLDGRSLERARTAEFLAMESAPAGQSSKWSMDEVGVSGDIVLGPKFSSRGRTCRDYTHTVFRNGQAQAARGVACRDEGGSWTAAS